MIDNKQKSDSANSLPIWGRVGVGLLFHYIKIAFRNIWKYKSRTLISVLGLAVGFTCFALATFWIVHEMTFDSFHKNAKQMYVVYKQSVFTDSGYSRFNSYRMPSYLKETFPEIANAAPLRINSNDKLTVEGVEFPASIITIDTSFFRMFDVKILEGSGDFLIPGSNKLAITQKKAQQLFGNEKPIGKTVNNGGNEICAVVSAMRGQSNYAFDLISSFSESTVSSQELDEYYAETIIELFPGTNIDSFEKKLYDHAISVRDNRYLNNMIMRPITKIRYTDPDIEREVRFQHIVIFSVSGLLVILCSLFNSLTLFVNRFRIRQKELALRVVCGASGRSLLVMLSVEFVLVLLFAVVLGCALTQWIHKPFLTLSDIQANLPAIYRESLLYVGCVILVALFVFWVILLIFRNKSLNVSIRRNSKKLSRKISVIVQLVISIGFAFSVAVIMKQMYFLHHTNELGFSFQNRGAVSFWETSMIGYGVLANHIKQIPEIIEIVDADGMTDLLSPGIRISYTARLWDDKPVDAENINMEQMTVSPEYVVFNDLRLVAGEMLTDADPDSLVLLNESAIREFGWHDAVGKHFDRYTVKGVIKNIYNLAPTIEAKPFLYKKGKNEPMSFNIFDGGQTRFFRVVLFKYREGLWKPCKEKIDRLIEKEYANATIVIISNSEEEYNKLLKSENALIKLLSFVSAICLLICVFGFVSLVSLTCEERRKSIAIRKINGATTGDILVMFVKEYSLLLIIGATFAFSAGYFVMQRWLEQYVKRTSIPAWLYLSILCVMALVIVLCVGWQVYKTSVKNPAEVVKGE